MAISGKQKKLPELRQSQNSCFIEGFHPHFRESGPAPLFHPVSVRKKTLFRDVPGVCYCVSLVKMCPRDPLKCVREKNWLGHPYFGWPCEVCDLFRVTFSVIFTQTVLIFLTKVQVNMSLSNLSPSPIRFVKIFVFPMLFGHNNGPLQQPKTLPNLFQLSFSVQLAVTLFYSPCTNSSGGPVINSWS